MAGPICASDEPRYEARVMSKGKSDPVDAIVGRNIRIRRIDKGLTQTDLAKGIGVTFQQVQKYEQGTNRVGGGRLYKIADVLSLPISAFFEGAGSPHHKVKDSPSALLAEPHALRLLRSFCQIDDMEARRAVTEVVEMLAYNNSLQVDNHRSQAADDNRR
jgi:transcriptional regulator with XRE-family HTH domain